MKTPKEKAKELVNKFYWEIDHTYLSKQCALIAVDEILDNFGLTTNGQMFYAEYRTVEYYQEVKKEINNL